MEAEKEWCFRVQVWWPKGGSDWFNFREQKDAWKLYQWLKFVPRVDESFGFYPLDEGLSFYRDFYYAQEMILKKLGEEKGDGDRAAFGTSPAGLLLREESV